MHVPSRLRAVLAVTVAIALASGWRPAGEPQSTATAGPRIEIAFSREARTEPVTGMVYVAVSHTAQPPPIEQTSPTGVPLFSQLVEGLEPGASATITADDRGHPVRSLRDLPAGEY